MKVRAVKKATVPKLGRSFQAGEEFDIDDTVGKALTDTDCFVEVSHEKKQAPAQGTYQHREMSALKNEPSE